MADQLLVYGDLLLVAAAILGCLKSLYNGYVYNNIIEPLGKIDHIEDDQTHIMRKQDEIRDYQERQTDAIIALGESHRSDNEFDVETFREEVRGEQRGPADFLDDRWSPGGDDD